MYNNGGRRGARSLRALALFALACAVALLPSLDALACTAYPYPITLDNGAQLYLSGDEFFSYASDAEGRLLSLDVAGEYRYVMTDGDGFSLGEMYTPSGATARSTAEHARADTPDMREKLERLRLANAVSRAAAPVARAQSLPYPYSYANDPLDGLLTNSGVHSDPDRSSEIPLLVLRVDFYDIKCQFTEDEWHQRIFQNGVPQYYSHVSNNTFTYTPAKESYGTPDDGVISVLLPIDMPLYYLKGMGQNTVNSSAAGLYTGYNGKNYAIYNSGSIFAYALEAANGYIDYASYDDNNDHYISPTELAFLVVSAGFDASEAGADKAKNTTAIWPHSWKVNNSYSAMPQALRRLLCVELDGVRMYKYTMIADNVNSKYVYNSPSTTELPRQSQFGTACHELGHDLGLPDLYDTLHPYPQMDVDGLSLMASGSWGAARNEEVGSAPTLLDPFCRLVLGFSAETLVNQTGQYTLVHSADASGYNILRVDGETPNIKYLIENRQPTGMDRGLERYYGKNGGIVVWRIDLNAVKKHMDENELNSHENEYGAMPVFVDGTSYTEPFRSMRYYALEPIVTLRNNPLATFSCNDYPSALMKARLSFSTAPTPVPPVTGDSAQPLIWLILCLASALTITLGAKTRRVRRAAASGARDER